MLQIFYIDAPFIIMKSDSCIAFNRRIVNYMFFYTIVHEGIS